MPKQKAPISTASSTVSSNPHTLRPFQPTMASSAPNPSAKRTSISLSTPKNQLIGCNFLDVTIARMVEKDYREWHNAKSKLNNVEGTALFHEREIWWCTLGVNIGYEQDGTNELFERPILIVKKFNRDVLWTLPLTRTDKKNRYYFPITIGEKNSAVILSQLRLISSKRLQRRMHKLSREQFKKIVAGVQQFFPKP